MKSNPNVPIKPPTNVIIFGNLPLKIILLITFKNNIEEKHKATNPLIK